MLTMFPGKRRWQRLVETPAASSDKRRREEEDDGTDDEKLSDRTHLLSAEKSQNCGFEYVADQPHHEQEDTNSKLQLWRCNKLPGFPSPEVEYCTEFGRSSNEEDQVSLMASSSPAPGRSSISSSNGASWRGLKFLVKKQFVPPFPLGKDHPEQMPHLRQKRMEEAMNKEPQVLGAAGTNSPELRRLDAKIQNGINKSVIRLSTKMPKSKENVDAMVAQHDANLSKELRSSSKTVSAESITKWDSKPYCIPKANPLKENTIIRKLKRHTKKGQHASPLLMATSMDC